MKLLGRDIKFLGLKLAPRNAYVGLYHAPSSVYDQHRFVAVSPVPFVTFQFLVIKPFKEGNHYRNPVSPQGWFNDGVTWGDQ